MHAVAAEYLRDRRERCQSERATATVSEREKRLLREDDGAKRERRKEEEEEAR